MQGVGLLFMFLSWYTFKEVVFDRRVSRGEWTFVIVGHLVLAAFTYFAYRAQRRAFERDQPERGELRQIVGWSPVKVLLVPALAYALGALGAWL